MSLRSIFCNIFGCEEYVQLKEKVDTMATQVAGMIPILAGIAGQFPIALDATEVLAKLDVLLKPSMSVWIPHTEGFSGDMIGVPVYIKLDAVEEFGAFGFGGGTNPGLTFNANILEFVSVLKAADTLDWGLMDGNEINPGEVIFGGAPLAASKVSGAGLRELCIITFNIIVAPPAEDFETVINISNPVDDAVFLSLTPFDGTIVIKAD